MRTITIRVPDYVYETVRDLARRQGFWVNQYAYLVLADRTAQRMAEGYSQPEDSKQRNDQTPVGE